LTVRTFTGAIFIFRGLWPTKLSHSPTFGAGGHHLRCAASQTWQMCWSEANTSTSLGWWVG